MVDEPKLSKLPPELVLLIKEEVEKNVADKTGDDRLFIRQQLQRIAGAAKYVGLAIIATITILGIKTVGDLHSVAETLVKDSIEKKDPAEIYRKSIDQLYAEILIASGLAQGTTQHGTSDKSFSLTDGEYAHVLKVLLEDRTDLRISFEQGVLLLSRASDPIWQKSAAAFLAKLRPDPKGVNWITTQPNRASTIIDAFISKRYAAASPSLRNLINNDQVGPTLRSQIIDLARVSDDKDSSKYVETAFEATLDDDVKQSAMKYLVAKLPSSPVLAKFLSRNAGSKVAELFQGSTMSLLSNACELKASDEPSKSLESILITLVNDASISLPSGYRPSLFPRLSDAKASYQPLSQPPRFGIRAFGTFGVSPPGGGQVYSWPFQECANRSLSAIRSESVKQMTAGTLQAWLLKLSKKFASDDGSAVTTGLLLTLNPTKLPDMQNQKGSIRARLSDTQDQITIRIYERDTFGNPITLKELPLEAIQKFGFVTLDPSQGGYVAAEESGK
ncbi:hypothetical protein JQ633_11790 [Bradyrhizobium tropiciagri]|uniref:hypothetical protein n=1 Tax=Bradyrhizobium tropiciagri TaxID=312253 RepID=UPI001BAD5323|nr:hypothetical protein [Bradyrhizobium tropiciagri]MBR0871043.1 hypothetical protein [Bradyrhizobium tropiciagri]